MLPEKLEITVKSISNNEVTFSVYRIGDSTKVMEIGIDRDIVLNHTIIVDSKNSQRPAKVSDLLKGRKFLWHKKMTLSESHHSLGTFVGKEAAVSPSQPASPPETNNIDLNKVEVHEIKETDDPNSIQQKLRQKAEQANLNETLKAFADKYVK